jgi:hypothetical protein
MTNFELFSPQLLNESMTGYLSMQRMYCPFYDTLLFIFNNPIPSSMKSKSKFYYELKTIPDLNPLAGDISECTEYVCKMISC